ncbi:MarR family winged helix-turn-helix transcriptional regulator [Enterococcus xiangfangensis]|uniref:MarR family winged helix-turn-helix transcriptional regulator n=1 Tax=Enterococcus xiangfangensis TaxID=1296537 RepID=UPI0010F9A56A|nr:MarR family transcriptional regulator [Enterococcus xiangfangensis]MBM7711603.1 DNA-binding MarR family transcriptional regulator [Enterococcus xiangfangensis]
MNTGYLLMNISKKLKYDLNQALLEKGITVQQWAVIQQVDLKEPVTATELVHILDMDKPTISGIVQRLEKKELLVKRDHPTDKRSFLLSLTEIGRSALEDYQQLSDHIVDNLLSILTEQEQASFNHLLSKINQEMRD